MGEFEDINDLIEQTRDQLRAAFQQAAGKADVQADIQRQLEELTLVQEGFALDHLLKKAETLNRLSDVLVGAIARIRNVVDNFLIGKFLNLKSEVDQRRGQSAPDPGAPTGTPGTGTSPPPAGGPSAPGPSTPGPSSPRGGTTPGQAGEGRTYAMSKSKTREAGRDVGLLQEFLNGQNLGLPAPLKPDGDFGGNTDGAVRAFQRAAGLPEDGLVDGETLKRARDRGFDAVMFPTDPAMNRDDFPKNDPGLVQPSAERTMAMLGGQEARFGFDFAGFNGVHNLIRYTDGWDQRNVVTIPIPGMEKIPTFFTPTIRVHKLAAKQFAKLFKDWGDAGLRNRVLTFAGAHFARYKKGAGVNGLHTNLSNHSWGTAIDINAEWNGFGAHPASMGERGCVRELVAIANSNGFFWGGRFGTQDGMHFEVAKLIP